MIPINLLKGTDSPLSDNVESNTLNKESDSDSSTEYFSFDSSSTHDNDVEFVSDSSIEINRSVPNNSSNSTIIIKKLALGASIVAAIGGYLYLFHKGLLSQAPSSISSLETTLSINKLNTQYQQSDRQLRCHLGEQGYIEAASLLIIYSDGNLEQFTATQKQNHHNLLKNTTSYKNCISILDQIKRLRATE